MISNNLHIKKEKLSILKNFLAQHSSLAEQGSDEWLKQRQTIIGGSEIATLLGSNKYNCIKRLISQKVGLSKFTGNTATRWGSLFENMTELIFRQLFLKGQTVYSAGSIPHQTIEGHRYSPDGLCIMKINGQYQIVLLEFKSPLRTIPNGKIPIQYLPQVKAGLCTLHVSESGILVNNMFRKCKLSDLCMNARHDMKYHDINNPPVLSQCVAYGIILFSIPVKNIELFLTKLEYERKLQTNLEQSIMEEMSFYMGVEESTEEVSKPWPGSKLELMEKLHDYIKYFSDKLDPKDYSLLDIGDSPAYTVNEFLELIKKDGEQSFLKIKYVKPTFNSNVIRNAKLPGQDRGQHVNMHVSSEIDYIKDEDYINKYLSKRYDYDATIQNFKIKSLNNGEIPVAVLPWKLLKSDNIFVPKESDFLENLESKIVETVDIIKKIAIYDNPSPTEIANRFEQFFPPKHMDPDLISELCSI